MSTHIITLREVTGLDDEIIIRLVDTWDKDEIVQLYRAGGWWKEEYDPDSLPGLIRGSFAFAVAIDRKTGHAIGMGRVISDGVFDGYIQDLVVLPAYRKRGIGAGIIAALVARCTGSGISWIGLIAEPGTESFYQPLGFSPMKGYIPLLLKRDP
ncbi:MAG: GNAT family N-acetyltransferase [Methanoregula sp.]|uniref:GNAT family N-acetyltransferase n=1 Tax=Methanoregula sp. TaxID=2052170 RepID=UPI003D0A61F7